MRWGIFLASVAVLSSLLQLPVALADTVVIPMRNESAGTYYIQGDMAGLGNIDFLVDTGSGYTAITTAMLDALMASGAATFTKNLIGEMADGSVQTVPVYRIPEIRIGNCIIRDVDAVVFTTARRPILGMRSLRKVSPFTFSTEPPALHLSGCDTATVLPHVAMASLTDSPAGPHDRINR